MFDVIVRGGDVVDGSGAPRRRADVGIRGERIVAIGELAGDAPRVIDASGKVVAPGFVDVHTHYDAQVFWDGRLTPSASHGVTTVIAGNCGFSIAPLSGKQDDSAYLARMLARVEGIPLESLMAGVAWDWTSTAQYLDMVEPLLGINVGFMAGHSAIRRTVLGADAVRRAATADEIAGMSRLLRDALDAGAFGFSSSWSRSHVADGGMVPSRHATVEELLALCAVTGEFEGTSLEFIPMVGATYDPWAMDLMADMSATARRPLNWNALNVSHASHRNCVSKLASADIARARGGKVVGLVLPMSASVRLTFFTGCGVDSIPGWAEPMALPFADKVKLLADPEARTALGKLAYAPENTVKMFSDWETKTIFDVIAPENQQYLGRTVGEIAAEAGRDPFDVLCDISLADDLRTSFGTVVEDSYDDWVARVDVMRDHRTVPGASDAGAHLDMIATFNYATTFLDHAVRRHRLISLEEAVHLMTDVPARLYGLRDRGRIAEGMYADLLVIDPATVGSGPAKMVYDLPRDGGRLHADAIGVDHVLVNGTTVVAHGAATDVLAGSLLRSGVHTSTPDMS